MLKIQNISFRANPQTDSKPVQNIPDNKPQTLVESEKTISLYDTPGLIHTTWFSVNDIHGKMTRMERIYNMSKEFDSSSPSKTFSEFFKNIADKDISKFKVSSGDVWIGANEKNHQVASNFMKWCGFDVGTPGNHEFDVPNPQNLANLFKDSNTPILSANIDLKAGSALEGRFKPSTIIERNGEKYGFIGISPSDMFERVKINDSLSDISVQDIEKTIQTVKNEVEKLKNQGINKIILLSHSGLHNDKRIAQEIDGIDIIFSAHTHNLIKGVKEGENLFYSKSNEPTVIVQAGKDGENVGILNVDFDKNGVIKKVQNNILKTMDYNRPLFVKDSVENIIGKPEIIGRVKKTLPPPKDILIEDNPHGNIIADAMRFELGTDIALLNTANIRGHFSQGAIDSRLVRDITPFEDKMMVLELNEKQIVDALKVGCTSIPKNSKPGMLLVSGMKYTANKKGELLDAKYIDRNGVEHQIDVNNPDVNKKYTVATDDFIATGGDNYFPVNKNPDYVKQVYDFDKDKLACDYIKKLEQPIEIKKEDRFTIVD